MGRPAAERREDLVALYKEARACTRCPLHESRTQVVFGAGNADADLMFVGEAPGANEDQQGIPFVGRAGQLLNELLVGAGVGPRRCVHRECPEEPPPRQPRPAAGRDRGLPALPRASGRADRAAGDLHARQLRHQAPHRLLDGNHPGARRAAGARDSATARWSCSRSSTRRPGLRTPAVKEQLREDFAELPALLAEPVRAGAGAGGGPGRRPGRSGRGRPAGPLRAVTQRDRLRAGDGGAWAPSWRRGSRPATWCWSAATWAPARRPSCAAPPGAGRRGPGDQPHLHHRPPAGRAASRWRTWTSTGWERWRARTRSCSTTT